MRRASIGLLLIALLAGTAPAARASRIDDVRQRVRALRAEQQAAAARLDETETELAALQDALAYGRERLGRARRELDAARRALDGQLAEVYRSGGLAMLDALLGPSPGHVPDRAEFIMLLVGRQTDTVADARTASASYDAAVRDVAVQEARVRRLLGGARAEQRRLAKRFQEARDLLDRLAGLPGGQAAYPSQTVVTIDGHRYACPVEPPYSYVDTYGAPRPGGRTHQGVDIMAPYGAMELAYADGVISSEHSNTLGGITLWLDGDDGNQYYYAHLSRYAVPQGARVRAGQHIGDVGNSGDARYTAPHLHFEVHPGGGAAVDPYPYAKRVCG